LIEERSFVCLFEEEEEKEKETRNEETLVRSDRELVFL
jgi:hypothetical protein